MRLYTTERNVFEPELIEHWRSQALRWVEGEEEVAEGTAVPLAASQTRQALVRFNREGLRSGLRNSEWGYLEGFVNEVADEASNAFVLKLNAIYPQATDAQNGLSLEMQLSDNVALDSVRAHIAHTVSVLYLQVLPKPPIEPPPPNLLFVLHVRVFRILPLQPPPPPALVL